MWLISHHTLTDSLLLLFFITTENKKQDTHTVPNFHQYVVMEPCGLNMLQKLKWLLQEICSVIANNFLTQCTLGCLEHFGMQFVKYQGNYKDNTYIFWLITVHKSPLATVLKSVVKWCWKVHIMKISEAQLTATLGYFKHVKWVLYDHLFSFHLIQNYRSQNINWYY